MAIVCATSGFAQVPAPDSLVWAPSVCAPRSVSPSARKRVPISSSLCRVGTGRSTPSLGIVAGEFPALVDVALVFLVEVNADLGAIVSPHGPPLELPEEVLCGSLGVRLARRQAGEKGDQLVRSGLEHLLPVDLTGQPLPLLLAGAPLRLPVGLERFRQAAVDDAGHAGGARPRRMIVGGDDQ